MDEDCLPQIHPELQVDPREEKSERRRRGSYPKGGCEKRKLSIGEDQGGHHFRRWTGEEGHGGIHDGANQEGGGESHIFIYSDCAYRLYE